MTTCCNYDLVFAKYLYGLGKKIHENTSAVSGIIKITLVEGGKTLSHDTEIAQTFN